MEVSGCTSKAILIGKCTNNMEYERKKELERRKRLRLLQVREQSKEFASKLRKQVEAEKIHQRNKFLMEERKRLHEQQLEELNRREELYKMAIETIGKGHKEAATQPNVNFIKEAESARLAAVASIRGAKARKQQLVTQALQLEEIQQPIKQKRITRTKEKIRSMLIASLPKSSTVPKHQISQEKHPIPNSQSNRISKVLQEIPSNLIYHKSIESGNTLVNNEPTEEDPRRHSTELYNNKRKKQKLNNALENGKDQENVSQPTLSNECSCDYIVCCCHSSPRDIRKRCHSDSRVSSQRDSETKEVDTKKSKFRSRSCSTPSVRTLNYFDSRNLHESTIPNFSRVTHHSSPPKVVAENTIPRAESKEKPSIEEIRKEELKKKTETRSAKALKKEQLVKDVKHLLQELENVKRKNLVNKSRAKSRPGVFQRERDILAKNESKQKKMMDAFETLLHSIKPLSERSMVKPSEPRSRSPLLQTQHLETDNSPPPVLNLAAYQQLHMSERKDRLVRQVISSEETTMSRITMPEGQPPVDRSSPSRSTTTVPKDQPPVGCSSPSNSTQSPTSRSSGKGGLSPEVSVRTDLSRDINLTVKVREPPQNKKKCKSSQTSPPLDSSTSYFSPPENLTPSQKFILDAFMIQGNKQALNEDLKRYIRKLLSMSRDSIDNLDISSGSEHIDLSRNPQDEEIDNDISELIQLTELNVDQVNTMIDMFQNVLLDETPEQFFKSPDLAPFPSPTKQAVGRVSRVHSLRIPRPVRPLPSTSANTPPPGSVPSKERSSSCSSRQDPSPGTIPRGPPIESSRQSPVHESSPSPGIVPSGHALSLDASSSGRSSSLSQRISPKLKTPPIKCNQPQTLVPAIRQVGTSPDIVSSTIPLSPQYRTTTPVIGQPQNCIPSTTAQPQEKVAPWVSGVTQTPFGLSSNLLPHPNDVFGQPGVIPQLQITAEPASRQSLSTKPGLDFSIDWALKGLEPVKGASYCLTSCSTQSSVGESILNFELDEELAKRGLLDDFKRFE